MDILKAATDWAKAELFSTPFFILFGVVFMSASLGFWQLGKTGLAKAYIIPTLVAGVLLLIIGLGLFFTNKARVSSFEAEYKRDASVFVESEIARVDGTLNEYSTVFKVIPVIIIVAALLIIFINTPLWRAISITTIAMMIVILLVDGNAYARILDYKKQLDLVEIGVLKD
jgi:hypothetical protein